MRHHIFFNPIKHTHNIFSSLIRTYIIYTYNHVGEKKKEKAPRAARAHKVIRKQDHEAKLATQTTRDFKHPPPDALEANKDNPTSKLKRTVQNS